jgi:plasmid stabilization system protein ParE
LEFPERGAPRPGIGADIRMLVEGKYLIFYRFESKKIHVVRMLHGSQDRTVAFT